MHRRLWLILFLACSCATPKKPLDVPVGFILSDRVTIKWVDPTGANYETLLEDCHQCLLMMPNDFGLLLERCKRERK